MHCTGARAARLLALALLALAPASCEWVGDRLQTCTDESITLVNSTQTLVPTNLIRDGEAFATENLLPAGGSRQVGRCLQRGSTEKFVAGRDGQIIASVTCVASRHRDEYETLDVRVIYAPTGFVCESW